MALLELREITKYFGGLAAVDKLSLNIEKGEILGLIGPNGAGKTTVFNLISGLLPPTSGKVIWKDDEIDGLKPHQIATKGITRTFQSVILFHEHTLLQNVIIACYLHNSTELLNVLLNTADYRKKEEKAKQKAIETLNFVGLGNLTEEKVDNLPYGYQRALGIAIALATEPQLLLLDEPLTGMNQSEIQFMMKLIQQIKNDGISVILVEHNMRAVMSTCDRIIVIDFGKKIAEGLPDDIKKNKEVIEAYLGAEESVT